MSVEQLYQEIILDHYRVKRNAGLRDPYDVEVHHVNPTCGDEVTLRVKLAEADDGQVVEDVSYDCEGCSISQASTSVLADLVIGKPVGEALATERAFNELLTSRGMVEPDEDVLDDAIAFAGVAKYPARVKCALLSWMAWKDALVQAGARDLQGEESHG